VKPVPAEVDEFENEWPHLLSTGNSLTGNIRKCREPHRVGILARGKSA